MNRSLRIACAVVVVLVVAPAFAQTYTWNTTSSGNWNTAGNWSPGLPTSGTATSLNFGGSTTLTATNNMGNFTLNSLNLNNTAGTTTLSSGTLTFASSGSTTPTINMTGAGTTVIAGSLSVTNPLTINVSAGAGPLWLASNGNTADSIWGSANITINNSSTSTVWFPEAGGWTGNLYVNSGYVESAATSGDLFSDTTILNVAAGATFNFNSNGETMGGIAGAGTINGNANMTFSGTGNRTFSGSIQGNALVTQDVAFTLALTGSNTFTGGLTVSLGTVQLGNASAVPNSTVTVSVTNGLTFNTNGGAISAFNLGGLAGASNFSLTDVSGYAANLSIGGDNATTVYTGQLSGIGSLTKVGTGRLTISGSDSYTGATTITNGTLQLGNANAVQQTHSR